MEYVIAFFTVVGIFTVVRDIAFFIRSKINGGRDAKS